MSGDVPSVGDGPFVVFVGGDRDCRRDLLLLARGSL